MIKWSDILSHESCCDSLSFNEHEDFLNALEHAVEVACTLKANPQNWKWLLISIHNALQGALVCTLSGSHGTDALGDRSAKAVWEWHEMTRDGTKAPPPTEWLAPPLVLYGRANSKDFMSGSGGVPINTTPKQDCDIHKLNTIRNGFAHYPPRHWTIELDGLPRIVLNTVKVIEMLLAHPTLSYCLKRQQADRALQSHSQP